MRKRLAAPVFLILSLLLAPAIGAQPSFTRHLVDGALRGSYWVHATDVDGDGDIDLVSAAFDGIDWWENDGNENFTKHLVDRMQGNWSAHADDLDNDGDVDILACSPSEDITMFYENNGSESFDKILVDDRGLDPERVHAVDIDGDGDLDILAPLWEDRDLAWYRNDGNSFLKRVIDGNLFGAHSISAADFDGDGDIDVVGSGSGKTKWYENNGSESFTHREIDGVGGLSVNVADIDSDGDIDILRTQRNNGDVDWYENNGNGDFTERQIESQFGDSWAAVAGDIDGDGDLDVAAAGFDANNITVWFNQGQGSFGPAVVVAGGTEPRSVYIEDIDGDGDGDICAAVRGDRDLLWFEVDGVPTPSGTLTLTAPNGGESYVQGQNVSVMWNATGTFADIKIELSQDDGNSWSTIRNSTSNDGSYTWSVPATPSDLCLIRISDAADGSPSDISDARFTIAAEPTPQISSFNPSSGEPGTDVTILGSTLSAVNEVKFNGAVTTFFILSDTVITATVPVGAITGKIGVSDGVNSQQSSQIFTVTSGGGAAVETFQSVHDAQVKLTALGSNYGSKSSTKVEVNKFVSYFKFEVSGLNDPVSNARLRLFCTGGSVEGGDVRRVANSYANSATDWQEQDLTADNAPQLDAPQVGSLGPVAAETLVEVDVTAAVNGNGTFSFAIQSGTGDQAKFSTKEGSVPPELIVETTPGSGTTKYSLGTTTVGSGSVSLSPAGGVYENNTSVQLTAMPVSGWQFAGWGGDLSGLENPATITMTANKNVTATFTEQGGGGSSLTFNPVDDARVKSTSPDGNYGSDVELRIRKGSPSYDSYLKFQVSGLTGGVSSATLRLYVTDGSPGGGDIYSVSNTYRGSNGAWDEGGLTWDNRPVIEGTPLSSVGEVVAESWAEFDVTSAMVGNGTFSFGIMNNTSNSAKYYSKEGSKPPELVVVSETGGVTQYAVVASTQGAGAVSFSPPTGLYDENTQVQLTAVPENGWQFVGWSGDLSGSLNPESLTMDGNKGVTATFSEIPLQEYSLSATTSGSGSVTFNPAGGVYPADTQVQVTAAPASGWQFDGWSGNLSGSANPATVAMNANKNVTANFSEATVEEFTLSAMVTGSGSVTLNPAGGTYLAGTQVQLTADAASGWQLDSWGGDLSGNSVTQTLTMNSNKSVTASFLQQSGGSSAIVFNPIEDSRVKSSSPDGNYGGDGELRLRKGSPNYDSYLKFQVSGLSGAVSIATLRLYVTDGGSDGGEVYSVSNSYRGSNSSWDEDVLTWNNRPVIDGAPLSTVGEVAVDSWVEFDVTSAVTGTGTFSFGLLNNNSNSIKYFSKEGANPPELIVTSGSGSGSSNQPPVAVDDAATTAQSVSVVINIAGNDTDSDGALDLASVVLTSQPASGSASANPVSGLVTYAPAIGFSGTDSFSYVINDNEGATSNQATVLISVIGSGGGGTSTISFAPVDDNQVKVTESGRNYGDKSTMKVEQNKFVSYFKFVVQGLTGPVQSAKLRLYAVSSSDDGGSMYPVSNHFAGSSAEWLEESLNAGNAPEILESPIATFGRVKVETFVEVDITSAVTGNDTYSFALASNSSDQIKYETKEGTNAPELTVEFGGTATLGTPDDVVAEFSMLTEGARVALPETFGLSQNYPNPFNAGTNIEYALPEGAAVRIVLYNLIGQEVRTLIDRFQDAGFRNVHWNGKDNSGLDVSSGVYFVQMVVGERKFVRRAMLQK